MKLSDTIQEFLLSKQDDYFLERSLETYKRKIDIFYRYLVTECGAKEDYFIDLLVGFRNESVINAIKYYVKHYNVNFQVTVETYFIVIKSYFEFLNKQCSIPNENFDSNKRIGSLKEQIDLLMDELSLNKSREKSPITQDAFAALSELCNSKLNQSDDILIARGSKKYSKELTYYISAIATKILMLTGAKNSIIGNLTINDVDIEANKVRINNYWIHMPDMFGKQMRKYLQLRKEVLSGQNNINELLITGRGKPLKNNNSTMFEIMKEILGDKKAECVAKYIVQQMIKEEVDPYIIIEFTGISFNTYFYCYESLIQNSDVSYDEAFRNRNRYLDSKLRNFKIYDNM